MALERTAGPNWPGRGVVSVGQGLTLLGGECLHFPVVVVLRGEGCDQGLAGSLDMGPDCGGSDAEYDRGLRCCHVGVEAQHGRPPAGRWQLGEGVTYRRTVAPGVTRRLHWSGRPEARRVGGCVELASATQPPAPLEPEGHAVHVAERARSPSRSEERRVGKQGSTRGREYER